MLDHIRITVDVAGRYVGVANEIKLPQAVITGHPSGLAESGF